ncbi:hypothetical protein, conserved [Angomonas deanei]|uniref:EGF-like domain-containing protein n=1 Tax=Angomonas deanei TaxID=59799 RepID=A0A7G2C272_9TRYP|nr:hypothetical protein, conserved [Angomonas deanei]
MWTRIRFVLLIAIILTTAANGQDETRTCLVADQIAALQVCMDHFESCVFTTFKEVNGECWCFTSRAKFKEYIPHCSDNTLHSLVSLECDKYDFSPVFGWCSICEDGFELFHPTDIGGLNFSQSCYKPLANCDTYTNGICSACIAGYTLSGGRCVPCNIDNCELCTFDNLCHTCKNDLVVSTAGTACLTCSITHCASCTDSGLCHTCDDNLHPSSTQKTCVWAFEGCDTYDDSGKCTHCSDGKFPSTDGLSCVNCTNEFCASCMKDNQCSLCQDGYSLTDDGAKCVPDIADCYTYTEAGCKQCTNGKAPSTDSSTCVICGIYYCDRCSHDNECASCVSGFALDKETNTCVSTTTHCCVHDDAVGCSSCLAGYRVTALHTCEPCPEGTNCPSTTDVCNVPAEGVTEEKKGTPWWVWLLVALAVLLVAGVVTFLVVYCCCCKATASDDVHESARDSEMDEENTAFSSLSSSDKEDSDTEAVTGCLTESETATLSRLGLTESETVSRAVTKSDGTTFSCFSINSRVNRSEGTSMSRDTDGNPLHPPLIGRRFGGEGENGYAAPYGLVRTLAPVGNAPYNHIPNPNGDWNGLPGYPVSRRTANITWAN